MTMDLSTIRKFPLPPVPLPQGTHSKTFRQPPIDGSLTVAEMFEYNAEHSPEHPLFEYPEDDGTVVTIKWKDAIRAFHRAGRIVQSIVSTNVAGSSDKKPLVAILAAADTITYFTFVAGAMRAGHTIFPISTRNSPAAVAHLLGKTSATHFVVGSEHTSAELGAAAMKLLTETGVKLPSQHTMPTIDDFYQDDSKPFEPLPPYRKPEDLDSPSLFLHSSGSTSFPKPIPWTHYMQIVLGRTPCYGERDLTGMRLAAPTIPVYHAMGALMISWAAEVGVTLTAFKPQASPVTPSPDSMMKAVMDTKSDILFCVPSFVEAWAKNPAYVKHLQSVTGVLYGGGPLAKEVGDYLVSKKITVWTMFGSTEVGLINFLLPKKFNEDWDYFELSPHIKPHFVPQENGTAQLIIPANEAQTPMVVNTTVNGVPAYDTNDILLPHPTKPGFWKVFGRSDDQIMHSTGEKTNPGPLEHILNQDPHIKASLMFGRGRFNAGVLIETKPQYAFDPADQEKLGEFRNKIWPTVQRMNDFAPQHSRVFKEMITVTSPSKPFQYTAKMTPRRQIIIKDYEQEIDALYTAADESAQSDLTPPSSWSYADTKDFIRLIVTRVMDHSVGDTDDLFRSGCDSLQATWIRNSLLHALKETTSVNTRTVSNNIVYQHPTIASLTDFVTMAAAVGHGNGNGQKDATTAMYEMVEKYCRSLPEHTGKGKKALESVYLVTGTTGALGCALLALLSQLSGVQRIYAFNRKGSTALDERQAAALKDRGYAADQIIGSGKVVLVEAATEEAHFGLSRELYGEIRDTVTHIIHNAWPVNFNLSLQSFEPSIGGMRHLVDLALSSPYSQPPELLFISSIGVIRNIEYSQPVKETPVDPQVAVGTGYSESKWVTERLLQNISRETPLHTVSVRVGQLCGSEGGAWNQAEWFPSLLKSSLYLKYLPYLDKEVAWIPLDSAARAVIEMVDSDYSPLHLAHPHPATWPEIMEAIAKLFKLPMVPYEKWLELLKKSGEGLTANQEVEVMRHNPALKILDFFTSATKAFGSKEAMGIPQLDVAKAVAAAPSLRDLKSLDADDVVRWVAYWKKTGFI